MIEQGKLFDDAPQPTWRAPALRGACNRDPESGPGTCWHWWEGCPNAEKRGCYQLWRKARHDAAVQGR